MFDVTQPNRCLTETVTQVFSVEERNIRTFVTTDTTEGIHVFARSGYFSLDPTLSILNATILYSFSVCMYTEHCIATVLLQYSILYKNGMNIAIFLFLMLLFLNILYNKNLKQFFLTIKILYI